MPMPRLEHLGQALQDLREKDEGARDGDAKIGGTTSDGGSCNQADQRRHVGEPKSECERDAKVEFERDTEEGVVNQVYSGERGEEHGCNDRLGMRIVGGHGEPTSVDR